MSDVANREDAEKCLAVAKQALQAGNIDRALKFAEKAHRLYPSQQSAHLLKVLMQGSSQPSVQEEERPTPSSRTSDTGSRQDNGDVDHLISKVLKAKTFYEVLGIPQSATDSDIKKAYRKLALVLHPDKAKGTKTEDAFKAVSQAFSCLSDPEKRSYYDSTGYENSSAAASARAQRTHSGRQYYYAQDELDPEEIFNMFFGTGLGRTNSRVFHTQFGGRQPFARHAQTPDQRTLVGGLLQLLPLLLIFSYALISGFSEPAYSMNNDKYQVPVVSNRLQAPYYVKSKRDFDKRYPEGSRERMELEMQVEQQYYEHLYNRCQQEKLHQHRMYTWGDRERAKSMPMPNCDMFMGFKEKMHMQQEVY